MENRTNFLENLTKPNQEKNSKIIIDYHYRKMNFAYELIRHLQTKYKFTYELNEYKTDQILSLKLKPNNTDIMNNLIGMISSYTQIDPSVEFIIEPLNTECMINISISTKIIEDIEYDM